MFWVFTCNVFTAAFTRHKLQVTPDRLGSVWVWPQEAAWMPWEVTVRNSELPRGTLGATGPGGGRTPERQRSVLLAPGHLSARNLYLLLRQRP